MMYESSNINVNQSNIEEKKALCTGVTRVIAVLPREQWQTSLLSLANQPIALIDNLMKMADQMSSKGGEMISVTNILENIANEIVVLTIIIRTFNSATEKNASKAEDIDTSALSLLEKLWSYVELLASTQNTNDFLFSALSELLLVPVSMSGKTNNVHLLQKINDVMNKMIESVSKSNSIKALHPIMELVSGIIDILGPLADSDAKAEGNQVMSNETHKIREVVEHLTSRSLYLLLSLNSDSKLGLLPKMFSICTSGIQRCPILFTTIRSQTDASTKETLFAHTITSACTSIDQKYTDVSRAALLYLKEVVSTQNFCLSFMNIFALILKVCFFISSTKIAADVL